MKKEIDLTAAISAAKQDVEKADKLIRQYVPFIQAQVAKFLNRQCTDADDEFSIATIAFYEAITGYEEWRGNFLSYAAMTIRSRLIDYSRKENRHRNNLSLYTLERGGKNAETLADQKDYYKESENVNALRKEIQELTAVMEKFGVSFSDVSDNAPRQKRTLQACNRTVCYVMKNRQILEDLVNYGKLPMAELALGSGVSRKTLERHRKYILAMLLIQTNGYDLIREHLKGVYNREGGVSE